MMRFLLSSVAMFFGCFIMMISLATPQKVSSEDFGAQRQLYFGQEVLPDHLAYPALMVIDRIKLDQAPEEQKIFIQVQYAYRRLANAQQLMEKGEVSLATTTLTKAQKYLNHALQEATVSKEVSIEDLSYLHQSYTHFYSNLDPRFYNSSAVGSLAGESSALADIIASNLP